jgi:hypothetical protein
MMVYSTQNHCVSSSLVSYITYLSNSHTSDLQNIFLFAVMCLEFGTAGLDV